MTGATLSTSGESKEREKERGKNISHFPTLCTTRFLFWGGYSGQKCGFSLRVFGAGVMAITLQIHNLGCPWCRTGRKNRRNQWESLGSKWENKRGKILRKLTPK